MGAAAGEVRVELAGDGGRLILRLLAWQHPGAPAPDDEWIAAEVELRAEPRSRFQARSRVSVRAGELAAFRDALTGALAQRTGTVELATLEEEVGAVVRLDRDGTAVLDAFVEDVMPALAARLEVHDVPTDARRLGETLRQLEAACAAFPPPPRLHLA
ncbi:MAG TPA: hypothetical protein VN238_19665 [Solirubrobacteraceae bacterium]|nr:hypothetical protein [Solirubrobacteraceae bacterium]